ncbi:MAG TPA: ATP-binding protein [Gemmataceae bacterium]|nr:ATP-binding protein [Gemmataceae bacterium]
MLEHNRNQDNGESSAQPTGVELPPAIRADLLDPALWHDGLAKYARATNLAVALADAAGRLIGETINPRPTWSLLHATASGGRQPPDFSSHQGADAPHSPAGCPFSLAPLSPCNCVADALARAGFVVARDRTGLVHFAVPLVLGGHPLGALVAGQVFDQYPEQLPLEQVAKQLGLSPAQAWQVARLEHPVKRSTLEVYADLLGTLGQTFLQTRHHTILAAERRGQERTAEANEVRARLLKQAMSAREEEQRRIARDLHDGIGQSLTSLLLGLRAAAEVPTFEEARARLGELRGITASVLDEVRRLARGLRPSVLDDLGLAAALERYAADYTKAHGIAVDVYSPDLVLVRLPAEVETALYRIAQETLTNVLKHAEAKAASLVVWRESSDIHLTVEDDGCGFDNDALLQAPSTGNGLGLLDIRERALLLNGSVTLESRRGHGTTVHVCIPLREENHGEDSRPDR